MGTDRTPLTPNQVEETRTLVANKARVLAILQLGEQLDVVTDHKWTTKRQYGADVPAIQWTDHNLFVHIDSVSDFLRRFVSIFS